MKFKLHKGSKFVWILLFWMFTNYAVLGQNTRQISGTVKDETGQPLPGANIVEKGTRNGVQTDFDGDFTITLSNGNSILLVSYIGFAQKEIPVNGQSQVNIILKEDVASLDEVVIVGYGGSKKSDLTGAVAQISSKDIAASGSGILETSIAGLAPGVVVNSVDNSPGAGLSIKIRGTGSINAASDPLYVIDGFPVEGSVNQGGELESVGQSPLTGLNPNDIESISILKDASATAIYGARGANGVVIITTKSGKNGVVNVNFSTQTGIQQIIQPFEVRNALQQAKYIHDVVYPFDQRTQAPTDEEAQYFEFWDYESYVNSGAVSDTDWMDLVTQSGIIQNYDLSVSGGGEKSTYRGSIGYHSNSGVVKETDFERFSGNFKANFEPAKWVDFSFSTNFNSTKGRGSITTNSGAATQNIPTLHVAARTSPFRSPTDIEIVDSDDFDSPISNPLNNLENIDLDRTGISQISNFAIRIEPTESLAIKSTIGLRTSDNDINSYFPSTTGPGEQFNGRARLRDTKFTSWLNENTITYDTAIGNHKFNLLAGFTIQSDRTFNKYIEATNFSVENLGYGSLSPASNILVPDVFIQESSLMSYLGRVNYTFKDRYLLTASFRRDGSSKFAAGNKWGTFPSLAIAWKAHEESFIENLGVFDQLKFRAGWGQTGNPNISPYQSLANYTLLQLPIGNEQFSPAPVQVTPANPELRWEFSEQTNYGVDMAFLDNRIGLSVDYYIKETRDLLLDGDVAGSTGFSTFLYNSGGLENRGLEIALRGLIMNTNDFSWDTNLNISFNRNKIADLGELTTTDQITLLDAQAWGQAILGVDQPIGQFYGYKTNGLWQQEDFTWNPSAQQYIINDTFQDGTPIAARDGVQPGMWRMTDINGDGEITTDDYSVIGTAQADFTFGFNTKIRYKNFDVSIFAEGSYGRDVFNANNLWLIQRPSLGANGLVHDYWRPIQYQLNADGTENRDLAPLDLGNTNAQFPVGESSANTFFETHDGYIEDGSFLRIKNLTFGYTIDNTELAKSIRLYLNIINLHTFTKYSGYDASVDGQSLNGRRPGFDFGSYPLSRTFMLGVNVNL